MSSFNPGPRNERAQLDIQKHIQLAFLELASGENILNGPGTSLHSQGPGCEKVKGAQSHPTLCDPMDCSPPGSSVHEKF